MSNILITSAGKRVSLVKVFKNEAKRINNKLKVFTADANPKISAACQISDQSFLLPRVNDPMYIDKLIHLCTTNTIGLVIPTIDTELKVLAENKQKLMNSGIIPVISSLELVKKCRDKRLIHNFFKSKQIEVAKEYSKNNLEFPMFIKPYDGSRSVDTFLILSEDDLTDYHLNNEKLMYLEYIDHNDHHEYTCDMYYGLDGKLKCAVPRKRIEVRDGEVNKGKTSKNILWETILHKMSFIEGARGCLTAQFFVNNKTSRIVGIEVNPRFGGGYPLSYLAGANFPRWILQEYLLNETISTFNDWEDNLLMLRYDDEILVKDSDA